MSGAAALSSPETTELWVTPDWLFRAASEILGPFDLDVCATAENAKCDRFFTRADDGLSRSWVDYDAAWMNPPYGRGELRRWLTKAAMEVSRSRGLTVTCLVPARTESIWWRDCVVGRASKILFIVGRVSFVGPKAGSPAFGSAIVRYAKTSASRPVVEWWEPQLNRRREEQCLKSE